METKKCPVCNWEIKDEGKKAIIEGKPVVVCCDDCVVELIRKQEQATAQR